MNAPARMDGPWWNAMEAENCERQLRHRRYRIEFGRDSELPAHAAEGDVAEATEGDQQRISRIVVR